MRIGIVTGGCGRIISGILVCGGSHAFSDCNQQVFQSQFELFDLTLDLLRGLAESLLLQFCDAQPQGLYQLIMGPDCRRHPRILRLQGSDHRLQKSGVLG